MTLVAHYNFEQSSGALEDKTGNGNDSTSVTVTSRTATGILGGNAWSFDGTDDNVILGFTSLSVPCTVSVWVNPDNLTQNHALFGNFNSTSDDFYLQINNTNDEILAVHDAGSVSVTTGTATDAWQQIAFSIDGSELILYHNGVRIGSASDTNTTTIDNGAAFRLGELPSGANNLAGDMDELRVYDHALTPQEVQYLYEVTKGGEHVSVKK